MAAAPPSLHNFAGEVGQGFWHRVAPEETRDRPNHVYVDGVFDLFHAGHIAFLEKAKEAGGLGAGLTVGVISDADAAWKRRPFVGHADRVTMLRHCDVVDGVVEAPPLVITEAFLRERKIDFVVHGDDDRQERFFAVPLALGVMRYVGYTAGISTTDIARRVLQFGVMENRLKPGTQ